MINWNGKYCLGLFHLVNPVAMYLHLVTGFTNIRKNHQSCDQLVLKKVITYTFGFLLNFVILLIQLSGKREPILPSTEKIAMGSFQGPL